MPKLIRIVVPVSDLTNAAAFYATLLGISGKKVSAGRHYFDCDGAILCIYDPALDGDATDHKPLPTPVYLSVSDLESFHERAKAIGALNLSSIEARPWGERSFYMRDPFANQMCFVDESTIFHGQFFVGS